MMLDLTSKLNKVIAGFVVAHLLLLGAAIFYMSFTSQKINRIDLSSISWCFDNFDINSLCVLDRRKGKIFYSNSEESVLLPSDLLLIGDSHSIPIFMLLVQSKKLLDQYDRVIFAGVSSCFPISGFVHAVKNRNKRCKEIYEFAKTHDGDLGLALYWSSYLLKGGSNFRRRSNYDITYSFPNAKHLIIFEEKWSAKVDPRVIRNFQSAFASFERQHYEQFLLDVRSKIEDGAGVKSIRYYNLYRSFCSGEICSIVIDKEGSKSWAYSDQHHLSSDGLNFLANAINSSEKKYAIEGLKGK